MTIRERFKSDSGLTLVELSVTIMLIGVVSALLVGGVIQANRVLTRTDDTNRGLFDAKTVMDRLALDIRQARGVVCDGGLSQLDDPTSADPECAAHLQLWIDSDSDYAQDSSEIVTWRLRRSIDGEHFDVVRYQGTADTTGKLEATSLIVRTLFTYDSDLPVDAQEVTLRMQYDAIVGQGTDTKEATVSVRLRNKVG